MQKNCIINKYVFIEIAFLWFFMNLSGISWYNNNWSTYGVNLLARTGEFSDYFVAQSVIEYSSPQIVLDYIIIAFLNLGLNYEIILLSIYCVISLLLVTGIYKICHLFCDKYAFLVSSFICFLFIDNSIGYGVSGNFIWNTSVYHGNICFMICTFALLFMLKNSPNKAILLTLFACAFQIQWGFYYGLAIILYYIWQVILKQNKENAVWAIIIWFVGLCALMMFFSQSDSILSDYDFIEIYGRFRHPHHMIPSTWDAVEYFVLFMWATVIIMLSHIFFKAKERIWFYFNFSLAFFTALAFLVNYIFTDIYPLAIVIKLQPARMAIVFVVLSCISIIKIAGILLSQNKEFIAITGLFLMTSGLFYIYTTSVYSMASRHIILAIASIFIVLVLALFIGKKFGNQATEFFYKITKTKYSILILLCLFALIIYTCKNYDQLFRGIILLLICGATIYFDKLKSKIIIIILTILLIFNFFSNPKWNSLGINDNLLELGLEVQDLVPENSVYYADPTNTALANFTFFSKITPVVFVKNVPIHDEAIIEWLDRLIALEIVAKDDETDTYYYTDYTFTATENIEKAIAFDADYILIYTKDSSDYLDTGLVDVLAENSSFTFLEILS